jgi:hypothetical protein
MRAFVTAVLFVALATLGAGAGADDSTKLHLLSKVEASSRAQKFLAQEIQVDGALGPASLRNGSWVFPLYLGLGVLQNEPILVDRRTGKVAWAGLAAHKAILQRSTAKP